MSTQVPSRAPSTRPTDLQAPLPAARLQLPRGKTSRRRAGLRFATLQDTVLAARPGGAQLVTLQSAANVDSGAACNQLCMQHGGASAAPAANCTVWQYCGNATGGCPGGGGQPGLAPRTCLLQSLPGAGAGFAQAPCTLADCRAVPANRSLLGALAPLHFTAWGVLVAWRLLLGRLLRGGAQAGSVHLPRLPGLLASVRCRGRPARRHAHMHLDLDLQQRGGDVAVPRRRPGPTSLHEGATPARLFGLFLQRACCSRPAP